MSLKQVNTNMKTEKEFLTPEEASEYLRVNKRTIYRWLKARMLPAMRAGKQWRFRKTILDHWLEKEDIVLNHPKAMVGAPVIDASADLNIGLGAVETSLRNKIKLYKKRAREVEAYLSKKPDEWGRFQNEFNSEVNWVFRDIMNYEKTNLAYGDREKVDKLKRLFVNRLRKLFVRGEYIEWSLRKPFGYAGDYKIIDDIYQNKPTTRGFDRLFDNYYQMTAICVAVRNRKEDFKRTIIDFINTKQDNPVKIMNLACGSTRELKEILEKEKFQNKNVKFDCYDSDGRAINFAKFLLKDFPNINFFKQNALRLAATKNIESNQKEKYDFIYATGLFDYLPHKISLRLVQNLKKLIKKDGILAISNVRNKYSNPSVHFMEWVGDWNLIYRTDEEFKQIFIDGGYEEDELKTQYEQQGIMQYIFAYNKRG